MNAIELENKLKKFGYNLSNRAIANIIGITEQYYSNKKKNGTDFKQADIEKIENKFNISLMCDVVVSSNNMVTISASCGSGVINADIDYLQLDKGCKYIYCFANGCSMEGTINNNDLVIVLVQDYIDRQNDIYCFTYEGCQYIKRLQSDINSLLISADNKKFEDIRLLGDDLRVVKIIGRVVGIVRRF